MRTIFLVSTVLLSLISSNLFARPFPNLRDDPESVTVKDSKIVSAPGISAFPRPGTDGHVSTGGGPTSVGERNTNGKHKAKEKKEQSERGENDFWNTLVTIWNKGGIKDLLQQLSKLEARLTYTGTDQTWGPNGEPQSQTGACFEIAIKSNNESTCAKIKIQKSQGGLKLEMTRLLVEDGKLVYSTDDTVNLEGSSLEELGRMLQEVDPAIIL